jgi:hypothetical protein
MNALGNRELRAVRELTTAETDQVSGGSTTTFPFPNPPMNTQAKHQPLLPA